ncbi:MAG TPA: GlsB/YeaQ/YmgE family stress response membrane protein [Candidatus Acidoferrales bacterium]|nr:GlsB/YeaQ/YmgE family stress response membrane protein [Candidatus Acidoferrales bacterium]
MTGFATSAVMWQRDVYFEVYSHGFIAWIIIGLLAGWIAGHLTRGRGFGCIVDVILGLIGAVLGGWIFTKLGIVALGFFGSLAAATVGAILLVAIARLFAGGRRD